jgi:hypothetical protein
MTVMTLVLLVRKKVSKTEDGTNKFLNTGFFATYDLFIILLSYPVPDPMNTFFSSRGRLLKNFGSLVNTEPSTSLEYAETSNESYKFWVLITKEGKNIAAIYIIWIL